MPLSANRYGPGEGKCLFVGLNKKYFPGNERDGAEIQACPLGAGLEVFASRTANEQSCRPVARFGLNASQQNSTGQIPVGRRRKDTHGTEKRFQRSEECRIDT